MTPSLNVRLLSFAQRQGNVGLVCYAECLHRLKRSDGLGMPSCLKAAEALASLGMRVKDVREKELKQALKLAKKIVRDILLWRCAGNALGLDSREALIRAFEETCSHTHCDENTDSQLSNGYRRILEELARNTWVRNRSATSPMERHRKAEEQRAQLDCWAGSCSCSYKLHTFQHWKAAAPEQAARNRQTNR